VHASLKVFSCMQTSMSDLSLMNLFDKCIHLQTMYILISLKSFENFMAKDEDTQCGLEKLILLW
jgi:hypothetical protein